MDSSEDPTRIHPSTPAPPAAPPGGPGLTTHEPSAGGPGGPTDPPLPPTGGGGGDGWDDGPDGPDDGDTNRNRILIVIAGALVLIALFLGISLLQSDDDGDKADTTTPAQVETTPAETPATTPATPATSPPASTPGSGSGNAGSNGSGNSGGSGSSGGTAIDGGTTPDDTEEPADDRPLLTAGSVTKIKVNQNDTVTFRVKSDVAEEIHVHGYDKKFDIRAGQTKTISFDADLTGIFEIEFENSGTQIGELTVEP